jgi:hypothetical protein
MPSWITSKAIFGEDKEHRHALARDSYEKHSTEYMDCKDYKGVQPKPKQKPIRNIMTMEPVAAPVS